MQINLVLEGQTSVETVWAPTLEGNSQNNIAVRPRASRLGMTPPEKMSMIVGTFMLGSRDILYVKQRLSIHCLTNQEFRFKPQRCYPEGLASSGKSAQSARGRLQLTGFATLRGGLVRGRSVHAAQSLCVVTALGGTPVSKTLVPFVD